MPLLVLFHVPMVWALGGVLAVLTVQKRYPPARVWQSLGEPMTLKIVVLIWGIMAFRDVLQTSGAVTQVSQLIMMLGVPVVLVAIIFPLLAGVLVCPVTTNPPVWLYAGRAEPWRRPGCNRSAGRRENDGALPVERRCKLFAPVQDFPTPVKNIPAKRV